MDSFDGNLERQVIKKAAGKEPGKHHLEIVCPECIGVMDVRIHISEKVGGIRVSTAHRNKNCFIDKTSTVVSPTMLRFPSEQVDVHKK